MAKLGAGRWVHLSGGSRTSGSFRAGGPLLGGCRDRTALQSGTWFHTRRRMNGVGLSAMGKLLGHRKRATTAIYAHLDDAALRDAAAQAAIVIGRAMEYTAEPPPLPSEASWGDTSEVDRELLGPAN